MRHDRNFHIFKAARFNIDSKRITENQRLPKVVHRILFGKTTEICHKMLTRVTISRISHGRCSLKKGVLKFSQISQENTCVGVSFL